MRHSKRRHKLGVTAPHRLALLANLSIALITHGRIKTTLAKAKALRPFVEKIITMAKKAEVANEPERKLHFRRLAISRLNNPDAVATLFDERVAEFMDRPGGYTRIYKLGQRIGDAAEMALIELIDGNDEGYAKPTSRKKAASKPVEKDAEEAKAEDSEVTDDATVAEEAPVAEDSPVEAEPAVEAEAAVESPEESADENPTAETESPAEDSEAEEPSTEEVEPEADEPEADASEDTEEEK